MDAKLTGTLDRQPGMPATDDRLVLGARVLELTGSSLQRVVQARSFLLVEDDFGAYDQAFRSHFPDRLPSRTTVVVSGFAIKDALVEIDLVALRST